MPAVSAAVSCVLSLAFTSALAMASERATQPATGWAAIVADWDAFERAEDPSTAGAEGDRAALSRLPDTPPEADARRLAALTTFKSRLEAIDSAALPADDRFNHAFLSREVVDLARHLADAIGSTASPAATS